MIAKSVNLNQTQRKRSNKHGTILLTFFCLPSCDLDFYSKVLFLTMNATGCDSQNDNLFFPCCQFRINTLL